jgi:NADH dehydrogenase [ubiquinone] 1 alpha subcomplex assembly factor 7
MAAALGHPRHGYYMSGDPFGREGDFITAPEVSQLFGELIGLWCVVGWRQIGQPSPVQLVEIGPGRGTLMADALRAIAVAPDCRAALDIHMVETSPSLRAAQRETLDGVAVAWHDQLASAPEAPLLLVANELFDALPIHQFVRTVGGWRERLIDVDSTSGGFRFVLATGPTPALALVPDDIEAPPGAVAEVSPACVSLAHEIARRVVSFGGLALVVDYASEQGPLGDTLQAVRRHGRHQVLDDPGSADLSARVDFPTLMRVAREAGASAFGPVNQGDFLLALGIEARAEALAKNATAAQQGDIAAAVHRLVDAGAMGALFKVIAIGPADAPAPAGFEAVA